MSPSGGFSPPAQHRLHTVVEEVLYLAMNLPESQRTLVERVLGHLPAVELECPLAANRLQL